MTTKVVFYRKPPKNPRVIDAFPSNGFVSTIAAQHMIEELSMELVGCIDSDKTRGTIVIHDSRPIKPIRIYAKDDLVLIYSEVIVPIECMAEFSSVISSWLDTVNPKEVFLLAGVSGAEVCGEHEILGVATTDNLSKELDRLGIKKITDGMITGISADLLMYCMESKIPCVSLVTETHYLPDPLAAATMVKMLNGLLNLKIPTEDLMEAGEKIECQIKQISEQIKRGHEKYKNMEGFSPMYG